MESLRVRRAGFAYRRHYQAFLQRSETHHTHTHTHTHSLTHTQTHTHTHTHTSTHTHTHTLSHTHTDTHTHTHTQTCTHTRTERLPAVQLQLQQRLAPVGGALEAPHVSHHFPLSSLSPSSPSLCV